MRWRATTPSWAARAWTSAVDQLRKVNELVLPVTKAEAQAITDKAITDLRLVRRNALVAIATKIGMSTADADAYVRATDPLLEGQSFANEPGVLLAPDIDAIVTRATQLYAQVGDAAAKQLTQAQATPAPTPTARPYPLRLHFVPQKTDFGPRPAANIAGVKGRLRAGVVFAAALTACGDRAHARSDEAFARGSRPRLRQVADATRRNRVLSRAEGRARTVQSCLIAHSRVEVAAESTKPPLSCTEPNNERRSAISLSPREPAAARRRR